MWGKFFGDNTRSNSLLAICAKQTSEVMTLRSELGEARHRTSEKTTKIVSRHGRALIRI